MEAEKIFSKLNFVENKSVRGLCGFSSTAIGINMCSAPALMGNVVLWKPPSPAALGNYIVLKTLQEAGLPADVVNFVPGSLAVFEEMIVKYVNLAGVSCASSYSDFRRLWYQIGLNLETYNRFLFWLEQICGSILIVRVYPNKQCFEILKSIETCNEHRLARSIFGRHKNFVENAIKILRDAVGNFYINDAVFPWLVISLSVVWSIGDE